MKTKSTPVAAPRKSAALLLPRLTSRELEMEQLRRAITRTEESLDRLHAAVEACQRKHLRRCQELRRQQRLHAIAMKEAAR